MSDAPAGRSKRRRRAPRWAIGVLAVLAVVAAAADFLAPYRYDEQRNEDAFAPPTRIRLSVGPGWTIRAYVVPRHATRDPNGWERVFVDDPTRQVPVRFFVCGGRYRLFGLWPTDVHLFGVDEANRDVRINLFGADGLGRDLFARVLIGARVSLAVGPYVLLLLLPLALGIGGLSGYLGGWVDFTLQRLGEIAIATPGLPVLLVVGAALAARRTSPSVSFFVVLAALASISWGGMARVVRGQVLSLREREFVLAARAAGAGGPRILWRHILPHVASYVRVAGTLLVPGMMMTEASLSFLGLGIREPMTSWGGLLAGARSVAALERHPWLLIPGGFIIVSVLAVARLGERRGGPVDPPSR